MKKLVLLLPLFIFLFSTVKVYATSQSDFPNAKHATIVSINPPGQNSGNFGVDINFDNTNNEFTDYQGQFQDGDCYNDSSASSELYNADTGALIPSRQGEEIDIKRLS